MVCGSAPAKIDEKSRLKVPAKLQRDLPETDANQYFITSDSGKCAKIYPFPVWERITEKLLEPPRIPAKVKYERITSYYGMKAEIDSQNRILIPPVLREDAQICGDVIVIARIDHLEVWNHEAFRKTLADQPLTDADRQELAMLGFLGI